MSPRLVAILAMLVASVALAQSAPTPPPPPPESDPAVTDVPAAEQVSTEPTPQLDAFLARRQAAEDSRGPRLLKEALGGALGAIVGSGGLTLLFTTTICTTPSAGCGPSVAFGILGGAFVVPLGIWAAGRLSDVRGGYWWAVLGSIPGWVFTGFTFELVNVASAGRFNPIAYLSFLFPVISGTILYEWSAMRELDAERPPAYASWQLSPWIAENGKMGLGISGTF